MHATFATILAIECLLARSNQVLATRRIFAQNLEYCSDQSILLIQHFELEYVDDDHLLSFDAVVSAVNNAIEGLLQIEAIAYGVKLLDQEVDLCSIFGRACPAIYDSGGDATYTLNNDLASMIPRVVFFVPDLEASLRVTIRDAFDDSVVSCIQADLSNGVSTRQKGAQRAAVAIAAFTYIGALAHSLFWPISRDATAPDWHFSTLMSFLHYVTITGMLDLAYPEFYRAFTENFAFSFGLILWPRIKQDLKSFTTRTGGDNLTLSTYEKLQDFFSIETTSDPDVMAQMVLDANEDPHEIPHIEDDPVLHLSGIAAYSHDVSIPPPNAFLTALISFAFLITFVAAISFAVMLAISFRYRLPSLEWTDWHRRMTIKARTFLISNLQRVLFIAYLPLSLLAFYQFRTADASGWPATLISGLTLATTSILLLALLWHVARVARRLEEGKDPEPAKRFLAQRWSVSYDPARRTLCALMPPLMGGTIIKAVAVGALQGYPVAQVTLLLLAEAAALALLVWKRPLSSVGRNRLQIALTSVKGLIFALFIVMLPVVKASRVTISVIGVLALLMQAIAVIALAFHVVTRSVQGILWSLQGDKQSTTPPGTPNWRISLYNLRRADDASTTPPNSPPVTLEKSTTPIGPPPPLYTSEGPNAALPRITIRAPTAQTLPTTAADPRVHFVHMPADLDDGATARSVTAHSVTAVTMPARQSRRRDAESESSE